MVFIINKKDCIVLYFLYSKCQYDNISVNILTSVADVPMSVTEPCHTMT